MKKQLYESSYSINSTTLEIVNEFKDLGVTTDLHLRKSNLTGTHHFQTKARLPIFKLKGIKVPVDNILKLKRLLIQVNPMYHLPCVEIGKTVSISRKLLLTMNFILKMTEFCTLLSRKG